MKQPNPTIKGHLTGIAIVAVLGLIFGVASIIYTSSTEVVPAPGGEYREGVVGLPQYINPVLSATNDVDKDLTRLIYSALLSYDVDGNILIEDERITPTTFQALYLKADFGPDRVVYMPVDYLLMFAVSLALEEDEWETPVLAITEGTLLILDPNKDLLATAMELLLEGVDVDLAILVSQ